MASFNVIKRNGSSEPFDISKIRKIITWAAKDLAINAMQLESSLQLHVRDNMTTREIHATVIEASLRLTSSSEPDWRLLAARLKLVDFYKDVHIARNIPYNYSYPNYYETVTDFVNKKIYSDVLIKKYSTQELQEAGTFLNQDYDFDFDYAGISLAINRYMLEYNDAPIEMPQEALLTASLLIEQNQPKERRLQCVRETYTMLAARKISLATPILLNLRKPKGNLSSCFITTFSDNTNDIFHTFEQLGQISSSGGGVGMYLSHLRAQGARIKGIAGRAGGVIPTIRVINDIALYFNQGGKRAGAVTVALDSWHLDIEDFLELQTENGDQRRKAYDVFPQVVVTDCYMNAVKNDDTWYLFDPHEIKGKYKIDLPSLWGESFTSMYQRLCADADAGKIELFRKINAKKLYKHIMKAQTETGMPYITFKDAINRANPNPHVGMIPCTNLCVESFSVVSPSNLGKMEENEELLTRSYAPGLVHTCNLVSLNMANVTLEEMPQVCDTAVRILDNCIDLTDAPVPESIRHNHLLRTIGVGLMGYADYLAINDTLYTKAVDKTDELAEHFAYYTILASCRLAAERGQYPLYEGSTWSQGLILGRDRSWYASHGTLDWDSLFDAIALHGIRNSHIQAIAPNTSSSIIQGCTASILPVFSRFYMENNSNGLTVMTPPYIKDKFWYYQESRNVDQRVVVDVVSRFQKWVDTGISMELLFDLNKGITAKQIYDTHMEAHEKNCKAIYYTRWIQVDTDKASEKPECSTCAS